MLHFRVRGVFSTPGLSSEWTSRPPLGNAARLRAVPRVEWGCDSDTPDPTRSEGHGVTVVFRIEGRPSIDLSVLARDCLRFYDSTRETYAAPPKSG